MVDFTLADLEEKKVTTSMQKYCSNNIEILAERLVNKFADFG
jgi:hypothetical protein